VSIRFEMDGGSPENWISPRFKDDLTTHLIFKIVLLAIEWNGGKVLGLLEYMGHLFQG